MLPRIKTLLAGAGIVLSILSYGNGITFTKGSWNEILQKAKQEKKLIFVDFYADWCGPCKWMSNQVFTETSVGEFFNENFINVSVDAENEFADLVQRSDIDAYPTLIFFDANGLEIERSVGALDVEDLLDFGRSSIGPDVFKAAYLKDPTNTKMVYEYASALNSSDPAQANSIVQEYFMDVESKNMITESNWKLIKKFINPSSTVFEEVYSNLEEFHQAYGEELMNYMLESVGYYIDEAISASDLTLLDKSVELEYKSRLLSNTAAFPKEYYLLESTYIYHHRREEYDQFVKTYNKLVRNHLWNKEDELVTAVLSINENYLSDNPDSPHSELILGWSEQAISLNKESWKGYFVKADTHHSIGEDDKAVEFAKIALKKTEDAELKSSLESYIEEIESTSFMGWSDE